MFEHRAPSYWTTSSHQCVPGPNQYSGAYNDEYHQEQFPFRNVDHSLFLAADKIDKSVLNGQDPVTSIIRKKIRWNQHYALTKTYLRRNKKVLQRLRQFEHDMSLKGSGVTIQPQKQMDYLHFLQLANKDPDREFKGDYNWYYAGGTLSHLSLANNHFLISTRGKKGDQLYVTSLEEAPDWHPKLNSAIDITPTKGDTIYQVLGVDGSGTIGVRQRNNCSIYKLGQENSMLTLEKCHKSFSDKPITGLDVSTQDERQYCTITTEQHMKLWDVANSCCINSGTLKRTGKRSSNHWCNIQYNQDHCNLIVADCCCINWLDARSRLKSHRKLCLSSLDKIVEMCEDISLVYPSKQSSHMLYVTTTHRLLLLDTRAACSPLQSWTHMMGSSPLYGCTVQLKGDREVVCIANQEPGEVQLANISCNCSSRLAQLPTLRESLNTSQALGYYLTPQLWQRLGLSFTGITCLPTQLGGLDLLTQTAAGDIFCHNLQSVEDSARMVQGLKDMNLKRISTKLSGSCRYNMEKIYSGLTNEELKLPHNNSKTIHLAKWQRSKYNLKSYVDLLACKLLEVWDIDTYPDWDSSETLANIDLQPFHEKINSWLNAQNQTGTNSIIINPEEEGHYELNLSQDISLTQTESRTSSSLFSQGLNVSQQASDHSDIEEESTLPGKIISKNLAKKKIKHVSGF